MMKLNPMAYRNAALSDTMETDIDHYMAFYNIFTPENGQYLTRDECKLALLFMAHITEDENDQR